MILALSPRQQLNGNNMKKLKSLIMKTNYFYLKLILLFFALLVTSASMAQKTIEKSEEITTIDGKSYYLHKVKRKQTLFSISKAYDVAIEKIKAANKEELKDGLKARTVLKIPVAKKIILHEVAKKETVYGIAKEYGITVKELVEANPILSNGLKYGQVIKVPVNISKDTSKLATNDTILNIDKKDTIIPDSLLTKAIKDTTIPFNCDSARKKEKYKMGIMVPFYTDELFKIDFTQKNAKRKFFKPFTFAPFYEGVLIALDSLEKAGLKLVVNVYDVADDTAQIKKVINDPSFKNIDLVIGPFYPDMINYLSQHTTNENMKIISPLSNDTKLYGNSNVFQVRASKKTHLQQLLSFIVDNHADENIIIVHDDSKRSKSIFNIIQKVANDTCKNNQVKGFQYTEVIFKDFFKEDKLDEEEVEITSIKNIIDTLSEEKKNVIFPLIMQKNYAVDFINKLNLMDDSLKENVILFGLPTWKNIESLDYEKMENLETHISTTSFIDYDEEKVKRFVRKYRSQYKTEPKLYAFLGYDITLYFLRALQEYGVDFDKCLENINNDLLSIKPYFTSKGQKHGFENAHIFIFKYKNYEKVDVKEQMKMEKVFGKKSLRKEKKAPEIN